MTVFQHTKWAASINLGWPNISGDIRSHRQNTRFTYLITALLAVTSYFPATTSNARVPPLIKTDRLYAVPEEFSTGTVFDDRTGWGDTTTDIVAGKPPEFSRRRAGGWVRFDTSTIPDVAIIKSVVLHLNVSKTSENGCVIDMIQLSHDPVFASYHLTWYDLQYGSRYVRDADMRTGEWQTRLADDAADHLDQQLESDWFAVGFTYEKESKDALEYVYMYGWDTDLRPYIDVEYVIAQRILSANWEPPFNVTEGDIVTMTAEVEGFPFEAKAKWRIFEDDLLGDDEVINPKIKSLPIYQEAGRFFIMGEWTTEWLRDRKKIPDYYFEVSIGSQTARSGRRFEDKLHITRAVDRNPPAPSPAAFETQPYTLTPTSIAMVAAEATDPEEFGVEYYFVCEPNGGGGNDSGWTRSRKFTDAGLHPNTYYGYKTLARDRSPNHNQTTASPTTYLYTFANIPLPPIIASPTPWTLELSIQPNLNPEATEYCIKNVTDGYYVSVTGGYNSDTPVWQTSGTWGTVLMVDLTPDTVYAFAVKARNISGTETKFSKRSTGMTASLPPDLYPTDILQVSDYNRTDNVQRWSVIIANHSTAGALKKAFKIKWILSEDTRIDDTQDLIVNESTVKEVFYPGQRKTYSIDLVIPEEGMVNKRIYCGVVLSDVSGETNERNNTIYYDKPLQMGRVIK